MEEARAGHQESVTELERGWVALREEERAFREERGGWEEERGRVQGELNERQGVIVSREREMTRMEGQVYTPS